MTTLREAAQQALEALEAMQSYAAAERKGLRICDEAIPALRTALAQQAEPVEPVDVGQLEYRGNSVGFIYQKLTAYRTGIDAAWDAFRAKGLHPDGKTSLADMIAKYTALPQRKPLTKEEISAMAQKTWKLSVYYDAFSLLGTDNLVALVRAVEKASWEKNHGQA